MEIYNQYHITTSALIWHPRTKFIYSYSSYSTNVVSFTVVSIYEWNYIELSMYNSQCSCPGIPYTTGFTYLINATSNAEGFFFFVRVLWIECMTSHHWGVYITTQILWFTLRRDYANIQFATAVSLGVHASHALQSTLPRPSSIYWSRSRSRFSPGCYTVLVFDFERESHKFVTINTETIE